MITALGENQIFVFGSNLAGRHGAGAAKQAFDQFGAEWGIGEGMTGRCYAFPTLNEKLEKVAYTSLQVSRFRLYEIAKQNPDKEFLLTKVGCGIAGFDEEKIKGLFTDAPSNIKIPEDWIAPSIQHDSEPFDLATMTHAQGVQIATRWAKNHAKVVLPEFVTTYSREICDVIGFNAQSSHMIEVKVSRGDFLRDKTKSFRIHEDSGMGNYRYYCCPRGMIGALEVPDGWGLVYIYPSGAARLMISPTRKVANLEAERQLLYSYARRAVVKGLHSGIMKTIKEDRLVQQ